MVVYGLEHPQARALAYRLLEQGARLHWGLESLPQIQRSPHGKPFFPQYPQYHFNLSHSGALAVCALDRKPVGVDIQMVRTFRPALLDKVCSPEERRWLRRQGDSPEAFARLWSLKESRCKQSGLGLQSPISAIPVPLPEQGAERLEQDGLRFGLSSGRGWKLSLCAETVWDGTVHWLDGIE